MFRRLSLLLLALTAPLHASILVTLGGGTGVSQPDYTGPSLTTNAGPVSADDQTSLRFTPLRVPCRDGRWTQINPPFLYMTDAEIEGHFTVMREMVLHAIREMRHDGCLPKQISRRLENTYNRNQVKILLGNECHQSTTETFEGDSEPIADEISLSPRLFFERGPGNCDVFLPIVPPGFSDSRGIILYAALLHEGLHTMQDFLVTPQGGEAAERTEARQKRQLQQNELDALALQRTALEQAAASLTILRNSNQVSGAGHFARTVAAEFLAAYIFPGPRNILIDETLDHLRVELHRVDSAIERRQQHLAVYTSFINGDLGAIPFPAVGAMNNALRRLVFNRTVREGSAGTVITSTRSGTWVDQGGGSFVVQTNNILRQQSPSATLEFPVDGVEFITGLLVAVDGTRLLVAGSDESTGDGFLIGYQDTDGDGFFEQATRTGAANTSDLFLATLVRDFAAGQILAFNPDTRDILHLESSGGAAHPYPDFTTPRGTIGFSREDVRRIWISENGRLAFGAPDCDSATHSGTKWLHASALTAGAEFIPFLLPWIPAENHLITPVFMAVPGSGFAYMRVRFFPGASFCVFIIFGPEKQVIAKQIRIMPGTFRLDFGQVWTPGTVLQLRDDANRIDSVKQTVWDPVAPRLCPPCPDDPGFRIDLLANPEADYYLNQSANLATWLPATTLTTDGYGMADFSGLYSTLTPPRFFQAVEVPPIP